MEPFNIHSVCVVICSAPGTRSAGHNGTNGSIVSLVMPSTANRQHTDSILQVYSFLVYKLKAPVDLLGKFHTDMTTIFEN